jgi:hypothetical protein
MAKIYYDSQGFPIYNKDDGWKDEDTFQAAALNDMARKQQQQQQQTSQEQQLQTGTPAGKAIATILPSVGGGLGALIPGAGETGLSEVGGSALGTIIKHTLRSTHPEIFGQNEQGLSNVADSLTDTLTGALPGIAGAATKALGASAKIAGSFMGSQVGKHIGQLIDSLSSMPASAQMAAKLAMRGLGIAAKMPTENSQSQGQ